MVRRVAYLAAGAALVILSGCSSLNLFEFERREAWRAEAEKACFAARAVPRSDYIERVRAIKGRGTCGVDRPLQVAAFSSGAIAVGPSATINCPMTAALEAWLAGSVQPAAMMRFGVQVVGIRQMSSYACRSRNNQRGARLSEHAFGNALDIGGFELADGRVITVKAGWRGEPDERDFLRQVHAEACQYFMTVLGPGVANHSDHFHVDLAHHGRSGTSRYCKPTPEMPPPPTYDRYRNMPVAGLPDAGRPAAFAGDEVSDEEIAAIIFADNPFGVTGGIDPGRTGAIGPDQFEDGPPLE